MLRGSIKEDSFLSSARLALLLPYTSPPLRTTEKSLHPHDFSLSENALTPSEIGLSSLEPLSSLSFLGFPSFSSSQ